MKSKRTEKDTGKLLLINFFLMKKIYIGSSNEILTYYQNTLLYNFLNNNWYELVKEPSDSEIIIYNALPYNRLEEKIDRVIEKHD